MPKRSLKARLLQLSLPQLIFRSLSIMGVIFLFKSYGKYNYTHIPLQKLHNELYRETVPHLKIIQSKHDCNYDDILKNERSLNSWETPTKYDDFSPNGIANGSYSPQHCNPAFSVAILVTYRNRQKQLDAFLPYIHNFLRKQNIHYKIYLIEQKDEKPWNKGMLYNIGAKRAIAEQFPCLVLHDIDLLPLDEGNLYACTTHPRHMSASIDKFRYVLPYDHLVGGVLAIRADQYVAINGFSNRFTGWGGEDDDIAYRIKHHELTVLRFPRTLSRYTMMIHRQEKRNSDRHRIISENTRVAGSERVRERARARARPPRPDGYDSTRYLTVDVKQHRLFTLISVTL